MRREIKFRAWDAKENRWYAPVFEAYAGRLDELVVSFGGDLARRTMKGMDHESLFPDRYILEQFTGFRDNNEKEIYEGDLVKTNGARGIVEIKWLPDGDEYEIMGGYFLPGNTFEIVGNIHENPELLEVSE